MIAKINLRRTTISLCVCMLLNASANAQTLSPQVIASAGGYQSNSAGSLSFTIGETNTQTLVSASQMLTQGFQQPFKLTLIVKAYLQGYYDGAGLMRNVLYNQGVLPLAGNQCDSIQVELRSPIAPYNLLSASTEIIQTDGTVQYHGNATIGQSYYIVIKHRNTIQTWSNNPVLLSDHTTYDFSTGANKAYGSNQTQVETGIFAFYSGDINQDENIDLADFSLWELDNSLFSFGYEPTDINGDGNIDLSDVPLIELNSNSFVFSNHP